MCTCASVRPPSADDASCTRCSSRLYDPERARRYSERMAVDRIDRAIISELALDSRLSIRTIAERVHISRTAAHNRVQTLVANGVIKSFAAQIDRKSIGLNVTAIVIVQAGSAPWPELAAEIGRAHV